MAVNTNLDNLKAKFYPFLLGHPLCQPPVVDLKEKIDLAFNNNEVEQLTEVLFTHDDWLLTKERTDIVTTPDAHLYCVRKARKIKEYIDKNNIGNEVTIQQSFLYWHEIQNRFYVVAQKAVVDEEVAEPRPEAAEILRSQAVQALGGQVKAFNENKPQRALTVVQAKALAEFAKMGYYFLGYQNLYFTPDHKVTIFETEPVKRSLKKNFSSNSFNYWFKSKRALLTQQAIVGISRLKFYCSNPLALKEVEKIEKRHVLWNSAVLVGKIALVCLVTYGAAHAITLLGIGKTMTVVCQFALGMLGGLKVGVLIREIRSIFDIWNLSCKGMQGQGALLYLEQNHIL